MRTEKAEIDAARRLGPAIVLSWKVKQYASKRVKTGKIAKLEGPGVYVTLGKASALVPGDLLRVYRGEAEIRDPDTHEILGRERKLVGELVIADVQNSFSKARLSGEIEVEFKVGDQVERKSRADAMVVLPFTTVSGADSAVGAGLAEQLMTELAKREILVVERAQFARVLEELAIQQSVLFDQARVQELGRLAGAFAVLTGTIAERNRRTSDVNCRLIEVDSGRVIFSDSYPECALTSTQPFPGASTVAGGSTPIQQKSFPQQPANIRPMRAGRARPDTSGPVSAIAHWPLDGNGNNALGNSLNGSLIGRPTFGRGPVNQALVLDGRGQYFSVPHDDAFDVSLGDFSLALWFRLSGDQHVEASPIASKGAYGWQRGWVLDYGADGKRGVVRLETKGDSERAPGFSQTSTNQNVVTSGEWHHVAVVVRKSSSGHNTKIYVDGKLEATGHVDQVSLDNPQADFYFGRVDFFHRDRVEKVLFLRGAIDDVWLFRGAISEAQVRSLMSNH